MLNLLKIKKVHFIGIGGIGVSAIAKMMIDFKKIVSGSDLVLSEITEDLEKRGATIFLGHKNENLENDTDLVIYSPAVSEDNPERKKTKKLKISELSYPEFLGELSKNYFTIAVSGTHGKTTTTALIGLILEKAGLDPTVIVGSKIKNFKDGNLRLGKGQYLVVEACEWKAHMLKLFPQIIILTNLEEDHLDYYKNLDDIISHFQKYIDKISGDGKIILNIDDENLLKKLLPHRKVITYGIKKPADIMAKNIENGPGFQKFDLCADSKVYSLQFIVYSLKLKIPGIFNVYNALAAATCALILGIKPEIIKETLEQYQGCWRRFEVKELKIENCKLKIVSDYAHHPTAVQGTIRAAREFYPNRRIFVVFQPHHHHRTKALFDDFVRSFDQADLVIVSEIYGVAGRELKEDEDISSKDLVEAIINHQKTIPPIRANKGNIKIWYAADLEETKKLILENIQENDILLIMGAGDIYKIVDKLIKKI